MRRRLVTNALPHTAVPTGSQDDCVSHVEQILRSRRVFIAGYEYSYIAMPSGSAVLSGSIRI